jgi:serine protein kinase
MEWLRRIAALQREEQDRHWSGTFAEYLAIVRERPYVTMSAHARIYEMIQQAGRIGQRGERRYAFFTQEMFGLDEVLNRIVEDYFHAAAKGLDVRRRLLLLVGPVSSGKSSLVALLKRGLERFSRTERGAIYAIAGCPMHEEPLHLIPQEFRAEVEQSLGVKIEGELCPLCRMRLHTEYAGEIAEVLVERVFINEAQRVGIGTFAPTDPKSQDVADLTGSIDFSTIMEFGVESDPRAYRFDGELNKANRGIMEFQEMLKCDEKFMWHLLSVTQEGNFKAGRFALISADEVVVAHTNEAEFRTFAANKRNASLLSRMVVIPVRYNLRVAEEEKMYKKMIASADLSPLHIAPHALESVAMFAILTRLKKSEKPGIDLILKMRIYNGESLEGIEFENQAGLTELQQEYPDEGMGGLDPRYVMNRISSALIRQEEPCIQALTLLQSLKIGLEQHPTLTEAEKMDYLQLLVMARAEYNRLIRRDVQNALLARYSEYARQIFQQYLDQVEAYCNGSKNIEHFTGSVTPPEERLMREIEEQIGISEHAKQVFREELMFRMAAMSRKGQSIDYREHEGLKEAIEKKLFAELKGKIRLNQQLFQQIETQLIADHGYCAHCARSAISYST